MCDYVCLHVTACVCVRSPGRRWLPKLTERYFQNIDCFFYSFVHAGQILPPLLLFVFGMFSFNSKVRLSLRPFCFCPVLVLGLSIPDSATCLSFGWKCEFSEKFYIFGSVFVLRCQCSVRPGCPMMFGSVGRSVLCFARQVVQSARPISIRGQRLHFAPGPFRGAARTIGLFIWMMMRIFASYIWAWFSHSFWKG